MFRKLLAAFGIGVASVSVSALGSPPYQPYAEPAVNDMYNLLFCDAPLSFKPRLGEEPAPWQSTIYAEPAQPEKVRALALDATSEGRVRALAFNWLRSNGHEVPSKQLLGVIVEVPLPGGLDALAVFSDGGVRYINQAGKVAIFEGASPDLQPVVSALFTASQAVVDQIGPWGKPRLAPPPQGKVRLTFLVSDGLYFGEGKMSVLQREALSAPIVASATELLLLVVKAAAK